MREDILNYKETLEKAMEYTSKNFKEESSEKRAAFVNSVGYFVHRCSGGYGGPSVREHAASRVLEKERYTFEEAVEILGKKDGVIFGPITPLHINMYLNENCFNDDKEDIKEIREKINFQKVFNHLKELIGQECYVSSLEDVEGIDTDDFWNEEVVKNNSLEDNTYGLVVYPNKEVNNNDKIALVFRVLDWEEMYIKIERIEKI